MKLLERLHDRYVLDRRARVLGDHIAPLLPRGSRVLEIGCGEGRLVARLAERRPDLDLEGIEREVRGRSSFPVRAYDGRSVPHPEDSFDVVIFVDVLHHADDPLRLLAEAKRVARRAILVKDHTRDGWLAGSTLRFMDRVGNERFDVPLPEDYWPRERWLAAFEELGLEVEAWRGHLGLYPWPFSWAFDRALHFLGQLRLG